MDLSKEPKVIKLKKMFCRVCQINSRSSRFGRFFLATNNCVRHVIGSNLFEVAHKSCTRCFHAARKSFIVLGQIHSTYYASRIRRCDNALAKIRRNNQCQSEEKNKQRRRKEKKIETVGSIKTIKIANK